MKFIVFGLGNFGTALATRLTELGHEVIGVDRSIQKVEALKEKITHTIQMDVTKREAVSALPLKDAHAVVVAIGENEADSLLATALLKQFDIKRIVGRVVSDLQRTVLEAIKIDEFIMPEEESADRLAIRLVNLHIIDSFKISENYSIVEAVVPERYVGMTLQEANLTNEYKVLVLTTLKSTQREHKGIMKTFKHSTGIAKSGTVLSKDDILVIYGDMKDIDRLID